VKAKGLWGPSKRQVELRDEGDRYIMAQSVVEWTGDRIAEAARQTSRATTSLADALEESLGATRRIAKQGGDTAEELMDDTIKRLQRHPVETVIATFSIGIATGITIGVATGIFIGWMMKRR
jgi:ElaB/YqjD/DUF883 family membrane-anchored ribosome-binding protein